MALWDDGINDSQVQHRWGTYNGSSTSVNGTVVDQNGDPVSNATVKAVGIDFSQLTGTIEEKRQKADAFRAKAKNPYPTTTALPASNWTDGTPDFQLRGSDDEVIDSADTEYAAVHTANDWDLQGWQATDDANTWSIDAATLDHPMMAAPAGEPLLVSIWRPSDEAIYEDSLDGDLPGQTTSGTIVVTQLNPSGDTRTQWTVDTAGVVEIAHISNAGTKVHEAAALQLSPGYYHIHPEGSPETGYTIAVGDPEAIATPYAEQLNNSADQLDAQADKIEEWVNDNKAATYTTTTNETGHYSLDIPESANEADLVAYKVPPGLDGETASHEDVVNFYEDNLSALEFEDFNGLDIRDIDSLSELDESNIDCSELGQDLNYEGAYYASDPARSPSIDPPASDVTVGVVKTGMPNEVNASVSQYLDRVAELCNEDDAKGEVNTLNQFICDNIAREEAEEHFANTRNTLVLFDGLKEDYFDRSGRDTLPTASELSDSELCKEWEAMNYVIKNNDENPTGGGGGDLFGGGGDTTVERVTDTEYLASVQKIIPGQVNESATVVYAHYTNGSTLIVNDSYIDIQETPSGTTQIAVRDYPLDDTDPAAVQFEFVAPIIDSSVGGNVDEGVSRVVERVSNPAFDGEAPTFQSIRFNTLDPGPSQRVTVGVTPEDDSSFLNVSAVTVYGPSGSPVGANVTGSDEIAFDTSGQGLHTIKMTVTDVDGNEHVLTERVTAGSIEAPQDPTVRARSTPFGLYAVVGDGLVGGDITTRDGGSGVAVSVQVADASDLPGNVHVYVNGLSLPPDTETTFRVTAGDSQESVSSRVGVVIHGPPTQEGAITYRDGDKPLTTAGTEWGQVERRPDQTIYRTYTDASGQVDISVNNNPGFFDRAVWRYRTSIRPRLPSIGPLQSGLPAGASAGGLLAVLAAGLLFGRRKRA